MRRSVVGVMSGISAVVVGVSLRASVAGPAHVSDVVAAPTGIVSSGASAGPPAKATTSSSPSASPATRSKRVTTRAVVSASPKPAASPKASPKPSSVRVNGSAVDTRYGPVQVQITVRSHRITVSDAIVYPQGSGRDQEINSYAVPQLNQEAVQAQSAQIDTVSGATYTSDGYRSSLQSAIDQAHAAGLL